MNWRCWFGHSYRVIKPLISIGGELIECVRCGKRMCIHHGRQQCIDYDEDIERMEIEMAELFKKEWENILA